MRGYTSYILPFFLALAFHLLVGVGVSVQWFKTDLELISTPQKLVMNASLVKENPIKARAAREQEQRRIERETRRKKETARKAKPEKPVEKPVEKKIAPPPVEIKQAPRVDVEQQRKEKQAEVERRTMEQGLMSAVGDEVDYQLAVTDAEKAQVYVAQIQQDIIRHWSRPPSARNGMNTLLRVFLVPTGEVVEVTIVKSSGNDAFDRSALLAVRKAERFDVPQDSRQFQRNFREFTVLFNPQDLRL